MSNAARMGDMTVHGGIITSGCDSVLIEGKPAARLGDMHVCPMCNPGSPPLPHVGGAISQGSTNVFVGGASAVRVGDMATCIGPPDFIASGCATVIIGDAAGEGQRDIGHPANVAQAAARHSHSAKEHDQPTGKHWIEYRLEDEAGNPISGKQTIFRDPDKELIPSALSVEGSVRHHALHQAGECKLTVRSIVQATWSITRAKVGDELSLNIVTQGLQDDTTAKVEIWQNNAPVSNFLVTSLTGKIQSNQLALKWQCTNKFPEGIQLPPCKHEYFFEVSVEECKARSETLYVLADLEVNIENAGSIAAEKYQLILSDGSTLQGIVPSNGHIIHRDVPPGNFIMNINRIGVIYNQ